MPAAIEVVDINIAVPIRVQPWLGGGVRAWCQELDLEHIGSDRQAALGGLCALIQARLRGGSIAEAPQGPQATGKLVS